MNKKLLALALAGIMSSAPAFAATTITPTTPVTINLSGTDAANSRQTFTFQAGTYTVALVKDVYTALSVALTNGAYNAGNFTDYYKYSLDGGATYINYDPTGTLARYATADEAFNAYSALPALQLTFATDTAVTFQIGDNVPDQIWDNAGGTSLRVTSSAVPEPATWAMMFVGFGGMGFAMRRRASTSASLARG